ncbi:hypothetical protein ACQVP2_02655 [Methylobacterium aquaticum]|uniref:hypothetical protein n=1 Tax=Methylobacterium aquaticum TaxID=270351 RepID=UPI003D16687A
MAVYRVLNQLVLPEDEFRVAGASILETIDSLDNGPEGMDDDMTEWVPVGRGLPLTVMIRHVYTGRFPETGFFSSTGRDIAVVSGVKDYDIFAASARALNFIATETAPHAHLDGPDAFSQGTALVTYSPAVLTSSVTVSVELAVSTFPQSFLSSLSAAFGSLAGLPILMPYAGYLLGAGQVMRIAGDIGHALFDGPVFGLTDRLEFEIAGARRPRADFRILAPATLRAERYEYRDDPSARGLFDKETHRPYAGNEPYIVLSLDGRERPELKDFAPTVASAAVLQRFFQVKDGQQAAVDAVVEGLRLVSDLKYRTRADELKKQMAAVGDDAARKKKIVDELAAVTKNIQQPELRP